jgi:hypothetical protein
MKMGAVAGSDSVIEEIKAKYRLMAERDKSYWDIVDVYVIPPSQRKHEIVSALLNLGIPVDPMSAVSKSSTLRVSRGCAEALKLYEKLGGGLPLFDFLKEIMGK